MISRRNIRVKVMQTLYTVSTLENEGKGSSTPASPAGSDVLAVTSPQLNDSGQKILSQHFDQTRSLFVYLLYFLTELMRYAEADAHQRAGKHLPNASDLNVNTKIAGNELLLKMLEDAGLKQQFSLQKTAQLMDKELLRKIYHQLEEAPSYKDYINQSSRNKQDEKKIIEFILDEMLLANELFVSHIEENFSNWDDDGEMIIQLIAGYISKPGSVNFNQLLNRDKEEFARMLLQTVLEKRGQLQGLIIPKLKNWDPERIALLDMIMMEMGVAEFLYFETIPPKVTINEYIDLAKEYSTAQSGHFVNGILDNIHKELVQTGKMVKVDYKKTDKTKT